MPHPTYDLHKLGWKAFQDLCISIAEECLKRPVQTFLSSNDGGRDGAFVGTLDSGSEAGTSTIQCKFTSLPHEHLTLSLLKDEIAKARRLALRGLARDYIIITNHPVSGSSEADIKERFEEAGVGRCRVFGKDWIVEQIVKSARLRMMVPRLYGLGDLSNILDERAYEQASMILSTMGDDLGRLVVTEAHRKAVRATTDKHFVLLLGAPAAGKSTIGASLAVGAADMWDCRTIRANSADELKAHINPHERQFFWIDDAWGSTQYQQHSIEPWNQVLPLIQSAVKKGTRFLLTSRDYIWNSARRDLKISALPLLNHSQVIINVHELSVQERAQILYNHLKYGDQPASFRHAVKPVLPRLAANSNFLPESARRLGSTFFTQGILPYPTAITAFFDQPEQFLLDTISGLSSECKAAIALVFLSGGRVPSPVEEVDELELASKLLGASPSQIRDALNSLNGSLLLLAHDESGRYWSYKLPTVGDAFAKLIGNNPELTELYLRGAKAELIAEEVVCGTVQVQGAKVSVPARLYDLLMNRLQSLPSMGLVTFLTRRADARFAAIALERRKDLLERFTSFWSPIAHDPDSRLLARLHSFNLLPEEYRRNFVADVHRAAVEDADASFLASSAIRDVLQDHEVEAILADVERLVLTRIPDHVSRTRRDWDKSYSPEDFFDTLRDSIKQFVEELAWRRDHSEVLKELESEIDKSIERLLEELEPEPDDEEDDPPEAAAAADSPLVELFRDVDL